MERFWYRHWLNLRMMLLMTSGLTLFTAIAYGFIAYYQPGKIASTHSMVSAFFALFTSSALGAAAMGFGMPLNPRFVATRHPSVYFTLSLPISRPELLLSRAAAAFGSLMLVLVSVLVAHVTVLLVIRQPVPILTMTGTTLMGAGCGLAFMSLFGLIGALTSDGIPGHVPVATAMFVWSAGKGEIISLVSAPSATRLIGLAAGSAALTLLAAALMTRKDV